LAKRFTDTEKWNRPWYRKLGANGRDLWNYLHENCDHAGFFDIDCEKLSFILGFEVTRQMINTVLRGKFLTVGSDRIFLFAFIEFQYGTLSETSRPHAAVIKKLKSERVWEEYVKGISKGIHTLKEQEQDKEQDKDQDKEKEKEAPCAAKSPLAFLFPKEPLILEWLEAGDFKIQKEILLSNSHHVLVEEIRKAYFKQEGREKRRADHYLYVWVKNVNNRGYGLINRNQKSSHTSPTNPTGNPYLAELQEKFGAEEGA
jgi:hypothetical protein